MSVKITIDNQQIEARAGQSLLDAVLEHGIDIPHLCHHKDLIPSGSCRMCVVEIDGMPNPVHSCGTTVQDGMVVHTKTDRVENLRRQVMDLFISDHPLDCVVCDKNGSCDLQKYAYQYNISESSFPVELSRAKYIDDNPFYVRDYQYCIMCGKCVRVCDEVVGAGAIHFSERGFETVISTAFDVPLAESSCVFCGNCVQICPTNALQPVSRLGKGRDFEFEHKKTICGYCGVGCTVEFATKGDKIIYAHGAKDDPTTVNGEFLCVKGRFGWDFVDKPGRLTEPLMRKDLAYELGITDEPWQLPAESVLEREADPNWFVPVSWETAIDVTATKLAEVIQKYGGDAVHGQTSARCTNEENYLFQKFMRAGVGTNNVDHCARL